MTIVNAGVRKPLDVEIIVPVENMGALGEVIDEPAQRPGRGGPGAAQHLACDAPAAPRTDPRAPLDDRVLQRAPASRATRGPSQRARAQEGVIEEGGEDLVKAHHGSLAREQRVVVEDQLKSGTLRAIVATCSLELGIDMGAVDLVIQVESPGVGRRVACSASAVRVIRSESRVEARSSRSIVATCSRRRSSSIACATG